MLTRRQFLGRSAAAGGALFLPTAWTRAAGAAEEVGPIPATMVRPFVDPLPIPPIWTASELASRGLTMGSAEHRFHRDLGVTPTFAYGTPQGNTYLGPIVVARRGTPVTYTATNALGPHPLAIDFALHGPDANLDDQAHPRAAVHMHGNYVSALSDGGPEDTFLPGASRTYDYLNDQQAGTLWYHDHALGITRLNVYAGLAGGYLIRDSIEDGLNLPTVPFEVPLILQDKSFLPRTTAGLQPLYYPNPWEPEAFGNMALVNGAVWPSMDVRRGLYRFRVYNGSTSRFWNLQMRPVLPMWQIGTDTGFMAQPAPIDALVLAPGERADILVDFSKQVPGDLVKLRNGKLPMGTVSPAEPKIADIMRFRVIAGATPSFTVPSVIPVPTPPTLNDSVPRRVVALTEIMGSEGDPVMVLLNAQPWETTEIERPVVDTLECWEIVNLTADTHPIHLHLIQFRLVDRQPVDVAGYMQDVFGTTELSPDDVSTTRRAFPSPASYLTGAPVGPAPTERGWKDTIQAHPGMVTRILVPFGPGAEAGIPFGQSMTANPFTGRYVWHCHILDHEDNEMMLPFEVVPAT